MADRRHQHAAPACAVALANVYYDIPASGARLGWWRLRRLCRRRRWCGVLLRPMSPASAPPADGGGWTPPLAAMAGVTYDAGSWVADLGYRLIYMPKISNYVSGALVLPERQHRQRNPRHRPLPLPVSAAKTTPVMQRRPSGRRLLFSVAELEGGEAVELGFDQLLVRRGRRRGRARCQAWISSLRAARSALRSRAATISSP